MVSLERVSQSDMAVLRSIPPYVGWVKAVPQELTQVSFLSSQARLHERKFTSTYFTNPLRRLCALRRSSKSTSLQKAM
jgi:hypothetical protein